MRILGMLRATEHSEAGAPPSKELMERMGTFVEEVTKAGVMLATDGLLPSAKGKRIRLKAGKLTITDGPFTESKELIAGFAILQADSKEQALESTRKFLNVVGVGECEVRQLYEMP